MNAFAHIRRCFDLSDGDIETALETRDGTRQLLDQLASVAGPNSGGAKILVLFARMAATECDWFDGYLRVEIAPLGDADTVLEVMAEMGGDARERVFPQVLLHIPYDEFARAVDRAPQVIAPLEVSVVGDRLVLSPSDTGFAFSDPPPNVAIDEDSLIRAPAPASPLPPLPPPVADELEVPFAVPVPSPQASPFGRPLPPRPPLPPSSSHKISVPRPAGKPPIPPKKPGT